MALPSVLQDYPGFGEQFGSGLGQGLSSTLQQLTSMKLNQIAQKQQAQQASQAFQRLPGVTPEIADFLSALSPEERKYPLQNLDSLIRLGQALGPQAAQHVQPEQSQQTGVQNLSQFLSNPSQQSLNPVSPLIAQALGKTPIQPAAQQVSGQPSQAAAASNQANPISDIFTSPEEKRKRRQEEREERKEISDRFKNTKETRQEVIERARGARKRLADLERFEELEGHLDTPGYIEFLKRSGLDIPALMNPESAEFEKIATGFLRDAKAIFGSRISNFEVEQFLKTIPSLSQSPEGRKRVIAGLKQVARGDLAYNEARREIMKENNNVPPNDLLEQIDDRVEAKLDKIAELFKKDLAKPVPEGQNRLITALQAGAGSVVGLPGSIIKAVGGLLGHGGA